MLANRSTFGWCSNHHLGCLAPLLFVFVISVGCGGSSYSTAPVSGQVTLDGEAVANATVTFTPIGAAAELGPGSTGRTDSSGRFSLELVGEGSRGALVGPHRVTIAVRDEASFELDEEAYSEAVDAGLSRAVLPPEASTGLEVEVVAGEENTLDFAFESTP